MRTFFGTFILFVLFTGCKPEVSPIQYGHDTCHWCQMQIADPKFGAEAVTAKGRTYKFDSAECLLYYMAETESDHAFLMVTDFSTPDIFVGATEASYLVCKKMPSPMGGYISAFGKKHVADEFQNQAGGEVFTWSQMLEKFSE